MKNGKILDEIYFSVDCEFDGPIAPKHSMLSFGSVAFTLRDGFLGEVEYNLEPLAGATMHPDNAKFWKRNPKAWEAVNVNQLYPEVAMQQYADHVGELSLRRNKPILIEYPGGCDFGWMFWYFQYFLGYCPFGYSSFSMKSYAAAVLKCSFRDSAKGQYPRKWFNKKLKHTHVALDDARSQADMFIRIMCEHHGIDLPKGMK